MDPEIPRCQQLQRWGAMVKLLHHPNHHCLGGVRPRAAPTSHSMAELQNKQYNIYSLIGQHPRPTLVERVATTQAQGPNRAPAKRPARPGARRRPRRGSGDRQLDLEQVPHAARHVLVGRASGCDRARRPRSRRPGGLPPGRSHASWRGRGARSSRRRRRRPRSYPRPLSKKGVRLAQKIQVGPYIPVGT
jgi:hypothetical protein